MKRRTALFLSVMLLGASACASSNGDADESTTTGAPSDAATTEPVAGDAVDEVADEPSDTAASNDPAVDSPDGSDPDGSDMAFCDAIEAIQSAEFAVEDTFGDEARALFDDVRSAAPSEVAGDVDVVIEALDAIAEVGISADENDPVAIEQAFEILLDPAFAEANENLEAFTSEACGIDLGAGDEGDIEDLDGFDI